jgi:hypothetical protein
LGFFALGAPSAVDAAPPAATAAAGAAAAAEAGSVPPAPSGTMDGARPRGSESVDPLIGLRKLARVDADVTVAHSHFFACVDCMQWMGRTCALRRTR